MKFSEFYSHVNGLPEGKWGKEDELASIVFSRIADTLSEYVDKQLGRLK